MTANVDRDRTQSEQPAVTQSSRGQGRLDRRSFLQQGGLAAAGLALAPRVATQWTSHQTAASGTSASLPPNIPKYVPANVPAPALKASGTVPAGYYNLPANLTESYPSGKSPAHGGSVTLFEPLYAPPPTSPSQNMWWQAVEKAVGASLTPNMVSSGSYPAKQAAAIASGNVGDMMMFTTIVPDFLQLLQHDFENLTPHLSGDNVKKYPNLAALPTTAWKNSMINGQIWGIPIPRPIANTCYESRSDFLTKLGAKVPTSGDEFTALCKELTGSGRWALGPGSTDGNSHWQWDFFFQMFGLPNNWGVKSGKFTSFLEVPAAQEALNYMAKLNKAGYYYPGGPVATTVQKTLLQSGKIWMYGDGITGWYQNYVNTTLANPNASMAGVVPPPYNGKKAHQVYWNSSGIFSNLFCGIAKASKSRIETLLQICDYRAAPFGSKEYMLMSYGVEGHDYSVSNGAVTVSSTGTNENGSYTLNYSAGPPYVIFYPSEAVVKGMYDFFSAAAPVGIDNPQYGLYSPTLATQGAALQTLYINGISDIVAGRQPVSSWSNIVSQWRSQGGDQIKKELAQSHAKAAKS